ncbi:MAG: biotin--[acetyl-CoA-carboxylase] ligase [Ruminococcaceae bacterium]|nr:biotin--[acetyl-CoA-carboxylase] ligase [Oscillospiraceae bacterium]
MIAIYQSGALNEKTISEHLVKKREVFVKKETTSTNDWAASVSRKAKDGSIFLAERQTKGRGRRGRSWQSDEGGGLFLSVLEYPTLSPNHVSRLTLCAAMAVCRGIGDVTGVLPGIKWPNDIVLNGKKVCGILSEMRAEGEKIIHVVIGIGVNVNQTEFPKELNQIATSLTLETGKEWNKNYLVSAICNRLDEYETFLKENKFPIEEYRTHCVTLGREVCVISVGEEYSAKAISVTEDGELVVCLPDGSPKTIGSGEVSVRGLFGYV